MKLTELSHKNLFFNSVKRYLPMFYLFLIILLLAMPVTAILTFNAQFDTFSAPDLWQERETAQFVKACEILSYGLGTILVGLSCLFGLFAGCAVMHPLMNRQSAVLFASLPVRREKQFAVSFGCGCMCYLGALTVSLLATVAVFAISGGAGYMIRLFALVPGAIVWFLFALALTLLVGTLCGMTSIQVLATVGVTLYLPAVAVLLVVLIGTHYEYLDIIGSVSLRTFEVLSPLIRMVSSVTQTVWEGGVVDAPVTCLPFTDMVSYSVAAAVLLCLSVLILRRRKAERAGQTVVFRAVMSVIKYAMIVPFSLLCGLIFYAVGDHFTMAWGMLLGGLLSFMLMNVILMKNARACFHGIKGFCVFAACFALCSFLLIADPFDLDEYVPDDTQAKAVTLNLRGVNVTFTEPEEIRAAGELMRAAQADAQSGDDRTYLYAGFRLKSGITLHKSAVLWDTSPYAGQFEVLYASSAVSEAFAGYIAQTDTVSSDVSVSRLMGDTYHTWNSLTLTEEQKEILCRMLTEHDIPLVSKDCGPQIMEISYGAVKIPIYLREPYPEFVATFDRYGGIPSEEDLSEYLSEIASVQVWEGSPDMTEYTDPVKIEEYYLRSAGFMDTTAYGPDPGPVSEDGYYAKFKTKTGAVFTVDLFVE